MSRGRRGANPNVLKAIGLGDGGLAVSRDRSRAQTATCGCGAALEFDTGKLGESIERCTNRRCPNSVDHYPEPDQTEPGNSAQGHRGRYGP